MANRFYTILLLFFLTPITAFEFSDSATVSLLTCSPGSRVHSVFGHTGLRIQDVKNGQDMVFNYGTFDFDTPGFLMKFIRGKLDYSLSITRYSRFLLHYEKQGRAVTELKINLSPSETAELIRLLQENYKKENRYYQYDFFFDNCSTRVLDIIEEAVEEPLDFNIYKATNAVTNRRFEDESYRSLLQPFIQQQFWIKLGIDVILGSPSDGIAGKGRAFLPIYLEELLSGATRANGSALTSFMPDDDLLQQKVLQKIALQKDTQKWIGLGIFVVLIYLLLMSKKWLRLSVWTRRFFQFIFGFIALFLLFMWFFTAHEATHYNLDLLVAVALLLLSFWQKDNLTRNKRIVTLMICLILLGVSQINPIIGQYKWHITTLNMLLGLSYFLGCYNPFVSVGDEPLSRKMI